MLDESPLDSIRSDILSSSHILNTIPPIIDRYNDEVYDIAYEMFGSSLLGSSSSGNLKWFGYLSSTGVYGDREGAWVSESGYIYRYV